MCLRWMNMINVLALDGCDMFTLDECDKWVHTGLV